jgi:predicted RNA-binding Zn-ribbon protein involved in translation (DUF1610 family)
LRYNTSRRNFYQLVTHDLFKTMCCPDCGEDLIPLRGIIPLMAVAACPQCYWNEIADGDRGKDEKEDYANRWCSNVEHQQH